MESDQIGLLHLGSDLTSETGTSVDKPASSDLTTDDATSSIVSSSSVVSSIVLDRDVSSDGSSVVSSIEHERPASLPRQIDISRRPSHQQQLIDEMQSAILEQVLRLTPQQINLMPLEHRTQVLELQKILR